LIFDIGENVYPFHI